MRADGRKPDELRQVAIIPDPDAFAEGSIVIAMGKTRVLCCITIEDGVPRWMQSQARGGGWITAEYAMLPRSTHQRTPRETSGLSGRTQEIRRLIGRSLRAAVDLQLLGTRTIIVDCDVLKADGGTRTAAITGSYIALVLALRKLIQAGLASEDILRPAVAAVSVGIVNHEAMLDLCYAEDSTAQVDINVVMNAEGNFIEVQGTAEGSPFSRSTLDSLLSLAYKGIGELLAIQRAVLGQGG